MFSGPSAPRTPDPGRGAPVHASRRQTSAASGIVVFATPLLATSGFVVFATPLATSGFVVFCARTSSGALSFLAGHR